MTRPTLTIALIVKNEADNLAQCLDSVKDWADDIVILDSGSTDATEAVARRYTDRFYLNQPWPGFGKQRQVAQTYVNTDFVLWLDADECVTPPLRASIEAALAKNQPNTAYRLNRRSHVFGRDITHSGWYPDYVLRLYRPEDARYNDHLVHESVTPNDNVAIETLHGDLLHYPYVDLNHYLTKSTQYAMAWSQQRRAQGKKSSLGNAVLHAVGCFLKMYVFKAGFLDGKQGFLLAALSAHSTFIKYADLWIQTETSATKP
ncbi:MAG: glycosyltransferase family 2 protein [Neisseriaceae bacterium]|nr:glycosyltransferase family 2 protein [Neisseriaceae bacterium]MBP6862825.1 glycosyltransferase family 2 protein [Neisseriaceae bacterium]